MQACVGGWVYEKEDGHAVRNCRGQAMPGPGREWPGPYEGVELKPLHKDEATGGVVVLRKFKAGVTIPAHIHPDANEWAYFLSGEWEESGEVYEPGTLFHAPKGEAHGMPAFTEVCCTLP